MKGVSVLMSIYIKEKPEHLRQCFDSIIYNSILPNEIVIVKDGPLTEELEAVLSEYIDSYNELLKIVKIEHNVGLGNALKEGMQHCSNEIIARMDTDDICAPNRFEKQLDCFDNMPDLSIVGSNISEFINSIDNIVSRRIVPENHTEICEYLKKRCPFNHMTVMFKKSEVEKAGGYLDWHYNEDSYLWVRMYLTGAQFYNIQEDLVFARIDDSTFRRRGGYKYYKSERNLFKFMRKNKIIGAFAYFKAKCVRFIAYVLLPNKLREWAFKKFLRKKQ